MPSSSLKTTIGPPLGWTELRRHSVICSLGLKPTSGAGLPLALSVLRSGLPFIRSSFIEEWAAEIDSLAKHADEIGLGSTTTIWDMRDAQVPKIYDFMRTSKRLIGQQAEAVSRLFCTHVLECSLINRAVYSDFVHGLIQISKPSSTRDVDPDQVRDWHSIWPQLISRQPFLAKGLSGFSVGIRKFCLHVNRLIELDLSTPKVTVTIEKIRSTSPRKSIRSLEDGPTHPGDHTVSDENQVSSDEHPEAEKSPSQPPLKLDWHNYLSAKSKFSNTNERLGLDHWDALPLSHVQSICSQLVKDLTSNNLFLSIDAAILIMSFLAGADLSRTLDLQISATPAEVGIDLTDGTLTYKRQLLFPMDSAGQESISGYLKIPLPIELTSRLQQWSDWEPSATLGELLSKNRLGHSRRAIEESAHQRLKQLGDPNFLAWPGKWSRSASKVFLTVTGSDLLAAVCTLSPQVSAPGALSYFHPPSKTINQACAEVYQRLGFAQIETEAGAENDNGQHQEGEPHTLLSDTNLSVGFAKLIGDFKLSCQACGVFRSATDLFDAFNRVNRLGAALLIFIYGGRGSRTDQLKFGSVLGSEKFFHLHDKDLDDERGSRLLPKVQLVRDILDWYLLALESAASTALTWVHHNDRKTWRELSNLHLRFDALAFQTMKAVGDGWVRKPLESSDIEQVAHHYFGAKKNFMRHVLVTQWACNRLDRNLLRVITGHSHDRLDMPSALSAHPAISVIEAAGLTLNLLVTQWVDPQSLAPPSRTKFQLFNVSLGRMYKAHTAYSSKLAEAGGACYFGRWHLAAVYVVNKLRQALLNGIMGVSPRAELMLHLASFDLIHDEDDLKIILTSMNINRSSGGFLVQWRRLNEVVDCVLPLQLPTSLLLFKLDGIPGPGDPSSEIEELETWLQQFSNSDIQLSDTKVPGSRILVLLSAIRMWADLQLPGITQFAYQPNNHSVQPEVASALKLLGQDQAQAALPPEIHRKAQALSAGDALEIENVLDALNYAADRTRPLGGDKARTTAYKEAIASKRTQSGDTWADLLNRCFQLSMESLISGKADAIQFSSMATYISALRPHLLDPPDRAPSEMREIDFVEMSRQYGEYERVPDSAVLNAQRAQQQKNAAFWLLRRMQEVGLPVPNSAFNDRLQETRPSKSGRVVHVTKDDMKAASDVLTKNQFTQPHQRLQATLSMALLQSLPLRAQELTTLRLKDLAVMDDRLLLRESKFDHLKSNSAWRTLVMPRSVVALFNELRSRLGNRPGQSKVSDYLFLEKPSQGVHLANATWLHDAITEAVWSVTRNWNFRVHAFRARAACELIFPSWEDTLQNWLGAEVGPRALRSYFYYGEQSAWRGEQTRAALGHSQVGTSVLYYMYNAGVVRAMAASATLVEFEPTAHLCSKVGVSTHALHKAMQRRPAFKSEPWLFLTEKIVVRASQTSDRTHLADTTVEPIQFRRPVDRKAACMYLGLRLMELSAAVAADEANLPHDHEAWADSVYLRSTAMRGSELRARQKGSTFGRALAADLRLYRSAGFNIFYSAWGSLSHDQLENWSSFLMGKGDVASWETRLRRLAEGHFDDKGLAVEIVLGSRHVDSAVMARLQVLPGVRSVQTVRDQGKHPRLFVFPCNLTPNLVHKSRYLSVARVVLASLQIQAAEPMFSDNKPRFF